MVAEYILNYLMPTKDKRANLSMIIVLTLGFVSLLVCEGFLAYFGFITMLETYECTIAFAILYLAGIFYVQAVLLFICTYFICKKINRTNFILDELGSFKKITNAFTEGFKTKS